MRIQHRGFPEIISAFERNGQYFGIVSIALAGVKKKYEFDIDQDSYLAIRRLVSMKPFGRKRGLRYHYYFSPGAERSDNAARTYCQVWIEQEDSGKEFEIEAPEALIEKLNWFFQVKDWKELSHLRKFK